MTESSDQVVTPFRRNLQSFESARRELVYRDDLTGLGNRRLLNELLEWWWQELVGRHESVSLLMIDLDRFKQVNDLHGHLVGDRVLRRIGSLLRRNFRADDLVVRFGGDEFAVVLPGIAASEAKVLAERARSALTSTDLPLPDAHSSSFKLSLSFSVGIASYPEDGTAGSELLACADRRLYGDKTDRDERRVARAVQRTTTIAMWTALTGVSLAALALFITSSLPWSEPHRGSALDPGWLRSRIDRERQLLDRIANLQAQLEMGQAVQEGPGAEPGDEAVRSRERIQSLQTELEEARREVEELVRATEEPLGVVDEAEQITMIRAVEAREAMAEPHPRPDEPRGRPEGPHLKEPVVAAVSAAAVRSGGGGVVRVMVRVSETGVPIEARSTGEQLGFGLEEAAERAAMDARFHPATVDGEPIESTAVLLFRFNQEQSSVH